MKRIVNFLLVHMIIKVVFNFGYIHDRTGIKNIKTQRHIHFHKTYTLCQTCHHISQYPGYNTDNMPLEWKENIEPYAN